MKIKEVKAIQDLAWCLWDGGCYFFCLCAVAEAITGKEIDVLKAAYRFIKEGLIDYDEKRPRAFKNCMYILNADKVIQGLTGGRHRIRKVEKLPDGYKGHYIERWTCNGLTHFVLPDYDPITGSTVRANGHITMYYLVEQF